MFDPTFSIGSITAIFVSLLTTACGVYGFIWAIRSSVAVLNVRLLGQETAIKEIKEEVRALANLTSSMAVSDSRINELGTKISEFRVAIDERLRQQQNFIHDLNMRIGRMEKSGWYPPSDQR